MYRNVIALVGQPVIDENKKFNFALFEACVKCDVMSASNIITNGGYSKMDESSDYIGDPFIGVRFDTDKHPEKLIEGLINHLHAISNPSSLELTYTFVSEDGAEGGRIITKDGEYVQVGLCADRIKFYHHMEFGSK